jgi:hypothetical protein
MSLTTDPSDPRLTHGSDPTDGPPPGMASAYLVLSETERAAGFVRPVRRDYVHSGPGGCGIRTTIALAIAETYARNPAFYGATYCAGCRRHLSVGEHGEFTWDDGSGAKVGT